MLLAVVFVYMICQPWEPLRRIMEHLYGHQIPCFSHYFYFTELSSLSTALKFWYQLLLILCVRIKVSSRFGKYFWLQTRCRKYNEDDSFYHFYKYVVFFGKTKLRTSLKVKKVSYMWIVAAETLWKFSWVINLLFHSEEDLTYPLSAHLGMALIVTTFQYQVYVVMSVACRKSHSIRFTIWFRI